ncbi:rhodanese-like domain-containing protein [Planctomicrobium piriforme]|uniref:Rhodanese-related sulfurtransferase n=1 Tax=Planctomicrobium piriforme TaxID=1576369 RepID=A0A1I3D364_9PLAN|nr:rhodanese-like domain-containing protein [Planctomicrobium piriforme]SFH81145.1 Rhodanese-related sulfurtransferase [Planctomicrobium piriforme]
MAKQHSPRFLEIVNDAKVRIHECTVQDVKKRLDSQENFTLIDVREESEFAKGRLPGAVHVGKGVIERDIEKVVPNPATPVVLYCGGGFRSALAADALQKMGYTSVISMDGGWSGWNEAGFPVEKPQA